MSRDANDILREEGEDALRAMSDRAWATVLNGARTAEPEPSEETPALEFDADIEITTSVDAIVKGVLHPGDIATLYGPSGVGKTFVAIDMGYHVALGLDWHGRRVRKCPVLLVILEGNRGARHRMMACRNILGSAGNMLARITIHTPLDKSQAGAVGEAAIIANAKALGKKAGQPTGIIMIDTLARAIAGDDENSAQDMAAFVGRAQNIARETGACVLTIHHPGKDDARGMRGSSALFAACDAVIKIAEQDGKRIVTTEKLKDGALGDLFAYRLDQVILGTDDDGESITSCVVAETNPPAQTRTGRPSKIDGDAVLRMIRKTIAEDPVQAPSSNHIPQGVRTTSRTKLKMNFVRSILSESDKPDTIHKNFVRSLRKLQDAEKIEIWQEYVWVTDKKDKTL